MRDKDIFSRRVTGRPSDEGERSVRNKPGTQTRKLSRTGDKTQGSCGKGCSVCRVIYGRTEKVVGPGGQSGCTYDRSIGGRYGT